eukprot:4940342-Lingulodinium_polyedra.AAC.1
MGAAGALPMEVRTVNRAELMAAVLALGQVHERCATLGLCSGCVSTGRAGVEKDLGRASNNGLCERARHAVARHDRASVSDRKHIPLQTTLAWVRLSVHYMATPCGCVGICGCWLGGRRPS